MLLLCALAVLSCVTADVGLQGALSSPVKMAALFSSYQVQNNKHYVGKEAKLRLRLFQQNIRYVEGQNSQGLSWSSGLNKFSDKTESERAAYLGKANMTRHIVREAPALTNKAIPTSVDWIAKGQVTAVKDQGSCGSCWSFGAMGALESHYKQESGVLRAFSEQDVLDCTYPSGNGCNGGLEWDAINGIKSRGNELFSQSDYAYKAQDGACTSKAGKNALRAAVIAKYTHVAMGEAPAVAAMALGSVAVSIHVISSFYSYKTGIYADPSRSSSPNHVLTGVGYTPQYIVVKNSWGPDWGAEGFIKVARNWDGCGFHRDTGYPALTSTGVTDTVPADAAATYDPTDGKVDPTDDDDNDDTPCEDRAGNCAELISYCNKNGGDNVIMTKWCRKTCGDCSANSCPSGTIRCSDGVCRHQHMC